MAAPLQGPLEWVTVDAPLDGPLQVADAVLDGPLQVADAVLDEPLHVAEAVVAVLAVESRSVSCPTGRQAT